MARVFVLLWLLLLVCPAPILADWHVLQPDEVSVNYKRYGDRSIDPMFSDLPPKEGLDLNVNTSLFGVIGWDNTVHSMTNSAQYHVVGLNLRLYLRITDSLNIGYWHFSQHILDGKMPYDQHFPVLDAIMVNFTIYKNPVSPRSLF